MKRYLSAWCNTSPTALIAHSAIAAVFVMVLLATGSAGAEPTPRAPSKIASLGGDITEIIYALGASELIVAIDSTSQYPTEALKSKKNVGYLRALSTEGVLATGATQIIASDRAGPPEVVVALKAASIPYREIEDKNDPQGVANKIRNVGNLIERRMQANDLAEKVLSKFATVEKARSQIKDKRRAIFVIGVRNGRATVAGRGTSADAMITLSGAVNAAGGIEGFKPVTDEQLVELAPDVVIVMNQSDPRHDAVGEAKSLQGLRSSPALTHNRFLGVDGLYMIGFGPRAPDAASDLMRALYPEQSSLLTTLRP
ncbi:MAG: hemin ABC transporter substrate-binding protein [Hyphomicrobium sp.]|nr:MAG: hemin ABC transporter substrate-binding protein [Hyphomicrobium sp.]PPD00360.1 MAG: hemin ABC transporter substrate-binding protein [Hyphomicrobium sp.]